MQSLIARWPHCFMFRRATLPCHFIPTVGVRRFAKTQKHGAPPLRLSGVGYRRHAVLDSKGLISSIKANRNEATIVKGSPAICRITSAPWYHDTSKDDDHSTNKYAASPTGVALLNSYCELFRAQYFTTTQGHKHG